MNTSDKRNAIKSLQSACKSIKYKNELDINSINTGSPKEFLKIYHYLLLDYSAQIASEILNKHHMELAAKSDRQFVDGVYRLTRDLFSYVPRLSKEQFFQTSFAAVKCNMCVEICELIRSHHRQQSSATPAISFRQQHQHTTGGTGPSASSSSSRVTNVVAGVPTTNNNMMNHGSLQQFQRHKRSDSNASTSSQIQQSQLHQQHQVLVVEHFEPNMSSMSLLSSTYNRHEGDENAKNYANSTSNTTNTSNSSSSNGNGNNSSLLEAVVSQMNAVNERLVSMERNLAKISTATPAGILISDSSTSASSSSSSLCISDSTSENKIKQQHHQQSPSKVASSIMLTTAALSKRMDTMESRMTLFENDQLITKQQINRITDQLVSMTATQTQNSGAGGGGANIDSSNTRDRKSARMFPSSSMLMGRNDHQNQETRRNEEEEEAEEEDINDQSTVCTYETPMQSFMMAKSSENIVYSNRNSKSNTPLRRRECQLKTTNHGDHVDEQQEEDEEDQKNLTPKAFTSTAAEL